MTEFNSDMKLWKWSFKSNGLIEKKQKTEFDNSAYLWEREILKSTVNEWRKAKYFYVWTLWTWRPHNESDIKYLVF